MVIARCHRHRRVYNAGAISDSEATAMQSATKQKPKVFHATMQVTRIEEWFVEAETEEEARALLEAGNGQRAQIGECTHFEFGRLID